MATDSMAMVSAFLSRPRHLRSSDIQRMTLLAERTYKTGVLVTYNSGADNGIACLNELGIIIETDVQCLHGDLQRLRHCYAGDCVY